MALSEEAPRRARGQGRSRGRTLLAVTLIVLVVILLWRMAVFLSLENHFGRGYDEKRFDELEADFGRDRSAFVAADARMQRIVASHPAAARVGWSQKLICVRTSPKAAAACEPTTSADQAIFARLPPTDALVVQAKDPGRVFFTFHGDDPPRYTIMSAPEDRSPADYADARGFRGTRVLEPGWTLLGPIADLDKEESQFPS